MIKKWKQLNQQVIFEHQRLVLLEDTVELPDGTVTQYLRYKKMGDAASVIAINDEGLILLSKEYSHPPNEIMFQLPGGGVPLGEDPSQGANRELMEECGLRGDLTLLGSYFIDNRRSEAKLYVFVARNLKAEEQPGDIEEYIENNWYSETEIDALIAHGHIVNAHLLAAWSIYKTTR